MPKVLVLIVLIGAGCSRALEQAKSTDPAWKLVEVGMTYTQVERIMGRPGTSTGQLGSGSIRMETYEWVAADGSKRGAAFHEGKLVDKLN